MEQWDANITPMIIPKSIVIAILIDESKQYDASGTSYYKEIKKNVKNIGYFI